MKRFFWYGISEKGPFRRLNEDYFRCVELEESHYFLSIADGVGGHARGDLASKLATDFCLERYRQNINLSTRKEVSAVLMDSFLYAHSQLKQISLERQERSGMGTTLSVVVIIDKEASIVHVGDSRIYLIRKGRILQLTLDHSLVNVLLRQNLLSRQEAENYPRKNVLTQSVGVKPTIVPQKVEKVDLEKGDIFFFSTDGLHNFFSPDEIRRTFEENPLKDSVNILIQGAMERGSRDNVTGVAFQFQG